MARSILGALAFLAATTIAGMVHASPPDVEVQAAAPTGSLPKGVSLSPDGRRLFVTNYGAKDRGNVTIYDASTLQKIDTIDVPGIVVESALAPDGRTLYVSNFHRNTVQFIDLGSKKVTREIKAGTHPKILVVSHDGKTLYAANWGNESVSVIDTSNGEITRTLRTEKNPRGMAVTRGGRLIVANFNGRSVDIFDPAKVDALPRGHIALPTKRIKDLCEFPRHVVLSPDESKAYVSCLLANQVVVLDAKTGDVERRVHVGRFPKALDVTRDGRYIVSADYRGSTTTIIDTHDWTTRTLDVPGMDAASGVVLAHTRDTQKTAKVDSARTDKKAKPSAPDPLRWFVTGWYDNHLYQVGVAGTGAKYTVDAETAALTKKRRLFHNAHPVE
jgi:YVTN family beta-propeller protein